MDIRNYIETGIACMVCCLIVTLVKCSTNETPDVEEQGNVEYSFKWDSLLKRFPAPKRLQYCFYPTDGGSMIQMDDDADGLRFSLPPARYKLLVFNCDAANIAFKNMNNFETAEAYIPATKAADGIQKGTIPLYGIAIEELEIKRGSNEPITFKPEPLVRSLSITVKVEGMEHITSCKGTISGMSSAINLSKQEVVANATTDQTFETTPSKEGVSANILMLGKPKEKGEGEELPDAVPPHEVTLDFSLSDGSTASSTIDLGTSLDDTEGHNIDVAIEANVTPGPNFTVTINRWEVTSGDSLIIE